jgi:hypothetical protein
LEGALLDVNNNEVILGVESDGRFLPLGDVIAVDFESEASYGFELGYLTEYNDFNVRALKYKESTSRTARDLGSGFEIAFGNPFNAEDDLANRLDGTVDLDVMMLDVTLGRALDPYHRSQWRWMVGVRVLSVEQELTLIADLDPSVPGSYASRVQEKSEALGYGILTGASGRYDFTPRVWLSTAFDIGLLIGSTDVYYDEDAVDPTLARIEDRNRLFRQMGLEVKGNVEVVPGFHCFLGYRFIHLEDVLTRVTFHDDLLTGSMSLETYDLGFNGVTAGLNFVF